MGDLLNFLISFFAAIFGAGDSSWNYIVLLSIVAVAFGLLVLIIRLISKLKAFALFGG